MAPPIASLKPAGLTKATLPAAEWMAENAFIPPGAHRFLTAGGLTIGLWGGREFMDIIVARRSADGQEIPREQVPEIFRPLHGLMRYNPYSDTAADRWKSVLDKLSPMILGAVGAWAGSKIYIHDKRENPFHPASKNVLKSMKEGSASLSIADAAANIAQGDSIRRLASPLFAIGSTTGTHIFGGLFPFTNSMSAQTFMQSIGRKVWWPGLGPVNRFFGNRGSGGKYMYGAMRDAARWMEANVTKFEHAAYWATNEELIKRAKDALQVFPHTTPAQKQAVADNMRKLIEDAYAHRGKPGLYKFITEGNGIHSHGLFDIQCENLLKDSGVKLDEAALGDNGPFTIFARLIGAMKGEKAVWKSYAEHLNKHHGYKLDAEAFAADKVKVNPMHATIAYAGGALSVGSALAVGGVAANAMNRRFDHLTEEEKQQAGVSDVKPQPTVKRYPSANNKSHDHGGNLLDWINGKPLDAMQWLSRVAINPPSMHRFMNAAYLSLALYGGMKFTNILTGRNLQLIKSGDLSKSLFGVEKVWAPFKPLHGIMSYTPGSAALQDRWRQAAHFILPVVVGAGGTFTGSHMFFHDRIKKLDKPQTLEDYADKISVEQSKLYGVASAVTSIFNTGSGIHLLPMFNYSSNLHNRYLLASGQQVAMPGLGKWWSGNAGLTPWGVKRSLAYSVNYLTYNRDARPREFASLVHSILGKLYPELPETEMLAKKQAFMNQVYEIRDNYLNEEGVVPTSKQAELKAAMAKMLTGRGFEQILMDSGLDPLNANLASNGVSGTISNVFGAKTKVDTLQAEYRGKLAERLAHYKPRTTAEIIAEHAASASSQNDNSPTPANDNSGHIHAERVKNKEATPLPGSHSLQ